MRTGVNPGACSDGLLGCKASRSFCYISDNKAVVFSAQLLHWRPLQAYSLWSYWFFC